MKAKRFAQYELSQSVFALGIFYFVIVALLALFALLEHIQIPGFSIQSASGLGATSCFFLFVVGLNSFKSDFYFACYNGISRKSMFQGILLYMAILSLLMAVGGTVVDLCATQLFPYTPTVYGVLGLQSDSLLSLGALGMNFLLLLCANLLSFALGYLITIAYYRMSTQLKVAVSVGVPAGLILLDLSGLTDGWTFPQGYGFLFLLFIALVIFSLLFSYLLLRRAQVKG